MHNIPATQFLRGGFSGLQAFRNVRAPILARPTDCTHRCGAVANRAAGPVTPRNAQDVAMPELRYRYVPESGNWHGETCTHWIGALSAATRPPPSFHIALATRGPTNKQTGPSRWSIDSPAVLAADLWVAGRRRAGSARRWHGSAALVDRPRTAWPAPAWKQRVRASASVTIDDTGWRVGGVPHSGLFAAATADATVFAMCGSARGIRR